MSDDVYRQHFAIDLPIEWQLATGPKIIRPMSLCTFGWARRWPSAEGLKTGAMASFWTVAVISAIAAVIAVQRLP